MEKTLSHFPVRNLDFADAEKVVQSCTWKEQFRSTEKGNWDCAAEIMDGEASRPMIEPLWGVMAVAIWEVSVPSPQPRSRIWSPGFGFRYLTTVVASWGTNEAAFW